MVDKRKPLPPVSSSSDESTSYEEESDPGEEQGFVRSDRITPKSVPEEEKDNDDDDDDEGNDDDDHDANEEDGAHGLHQTSKPHNSADRIASVAAQSNLYEVDFESDSESSSSSHGEFHQTADEFPSPKLQTGNGHGKRQSLSEKSLKKHSKGDDVPEKGKTGLLKRERDDETQEKGSSKKQNKGNGREPSKSESPPEHTPSSTIEKKKRNRRKKKKSEEPKKAIDMPSQQQFSQKLENVSAPKGAEKVKVLTKAVKDGDPESGKVPPSPAKPKIWTPGDELVLTKEILAGMKLKDEIPVKKLDAYWTALAQKLEDKLGGRSRDQLFEKVKRMRTRYNGMAEKFKDVENPKFRNSSDKELFGLWDQIWGNHNTVKEDTGREANGESQGKPGISASTVSEKKMGGKKVMIKPASAEENKVVHEESEAPKCKQCEKENSSDDESQSDDEADSQEKEPKVTGKDLDKNDTREDDAFVAKDAAVQGQERFTSQSVGDAQKLLQGGIEAALSSIQECARQAVKEWQNRALKMAEDTMKAAMDQARLVNGGSPFIPFKGVDVMEWCPSTNDEALHRQWNELRLKELDMYYQRLELMQKDCKLRQDQLKLQLNRDSK